MRYGKLKDGKLIYARENYITDDGVTICNFDKSTELMRQYGFKPVIVAPRPDYPVIVTYEEDENEIREILTHDYDEERRQLSELSLTKADFWIALLDRIITKEMVKEKINLIPDETLKKKTLIRLDDADHFWRGDASMDIVGAMFGLTTEDLDYLFKNKELPVHEQEPSLEEEN